MVLLPESIPFLAELMEGNVAYIIVTVRISTWESTLNEAVAALFTPFLSRVQDSPYALIENA